MTDPEPATGQLERWVRSGASIIAPVTVLSTLLFYFGYVSSRAQYEYFGIDVDTIGLSTQDYIMRSPQPLLMPLLVLTLVGLGALALHSVTRNRIAAADRLDLIRRLARGSVTLGLTVLGAGIVLLFAYSVVRGWTPYNLVTPLLLSVGGALTGYGSRVLELIRGESAPAVLPRRTIRVLLYIVVATGIFWMAATVAQSSGRGLAQDRAAELTQLPSVILDTKERLFLRSPGVEETALPESPGQTFHYRYRHLRLLIHGHDRMFLVPDTWSASNSTMVVPLDGSVRIQFQFQNQRP